MSPTISPITASVQASEGEGGIKAELGVLPKLRGQSWESRETKAVEVHRAECQAEVVQRAARIPCKHPSEYWSVHHVTKPIQSQRENH